MATTFQQPVLVVDDNEDARMAVTCLLEREGYAVVAVANGQEALDALRRGLRPCVILLDFTMPIMDGAAFRAAQRQDTTLGNIPTVLLTANDGAADTARDLGCAAALRKPFEWPRLADVVSSHCGDCTLSDEGKRLGPERERR